MSDHGLQDFYDKLDDAVRKIDNMKMFANVDSTVRLKIATIDGRYYSMRVERITKTEFEK